jgi:hypothetical protein
MFVTSNHCKPMQEVQEVTVRLRQNLSRQVRLLLLAVK